MASQPSFRIVRIRGLPELVKNLKAMDAQLGSEVQATLEDELRKTTDVAKRNARSQGFTAPGRSGRGTGALLSTIHPLAVRGPSNFKRGSITVDARAKSDGFPYPFMYENTSRPFIRPAMAQRQAAFEKAVEGMARKLAKIGGF